MSDAKEFLEVVADLLSDNPNTDIDLSLKTPLSGGGLELTSLELIQLLVQLEERLGITIPDDAVMNIFLDDVGDLFQLVTSCTSTSIGHSPS
ncbi:acyl carrier protein [Streptomyces sp. 7N604]|uniref:acyl carrier protein n=1 Tax=Streptomyces sp. 7N604 TaxID=3457415 RepID=UPI003FD36F0B